MNRLTWDFFLETFKNKFMGEQYMKAHKREFINLVQGELSVIEYEAKFVRLSRYATDMISQERDHSKAYDMTSFKELVDNAKAIEEIRVEALQTKTGPRKQVSGQSRKTSKRDHD
ncbi:putative alpha,alpha-trehalose-phosphate synthase [UDP-forming] 9 [Gossypium australe]|uniref:Putative alpha,alpha-trehalose-phosphate synthase [UDP-forming] 9 n=1 Tax=Gossypium australe TaxID=47621 RepID=A0A5B6VXP7_9ROSI|nr:putative alpha,alpha-trehalose-phosphate synthase [UDP-forming] 9 [Gossypium australe]